MLAEIFAWWAGQMRSLLPGGISRAGWRQDALIIAIDRLTAEGETPSGTLLLRRNGQETQLQPLNQPLPSPPAPHLPTCLRLPPGTVLCRDVTLPLGAARDLTAVIGFEMDRLTPFALDEVYWGVGALTPDRTRGRLSLRLAFVLRAPMEALLEALARLRLIPAFIEAETGRIDLAAAPPRPNRIPQTALAALCGLLALACLAPPFLHQQMALDAAAQAIAGAAPAAHTAQALRQQLAIAASGRAAIAQARRAGDVLQILATLTTALPDGTWLSDLTLKSGDLTMDGQSANAAGLIGSLSAIPGLRDPSFTAPVTRTADGKADQFSLHVAVSP
jgi:general secretion pathway protein L